MPHAGLPPRSVATIKKSELLEKLKRIDSDKECTRRVLSMEVAFRGRIDAGIAALPTKDAEFSKFSTSPYVVLIHSRQREYTCISEIEADILPAKVFSSMETSAGRMIEAVVLPEYGWETVESEMHTPNSALDGRKLVPGVACVATLKSGPRCLNDEMAENFADAVIAHTKSWAKDASAKRVEFTYGVLYGTKKQSNKKDWHILRNIAEKVTLNGGAVLDAPTGQWNCTVVVDGIEVEASVRIGVDWWNYLGGSDLCAVETWVALIRACISPGLMDDPAHPYAIKDLAEIVSIDDVPDDFNVALLQRGQLPWLFFVARHFCDVLEW